jgi:uncharacterized protein (TIGR02444 family)
VIDFPQDELWDYAIRLYADADVAQACLALQERHEVDVNVVLFCIWSAASGRGRLTGSELGAALAEVRAWHSNVVRHLRALRKSLKGGFESAPGALTEALRRAVAATEIDAEHIEQLMLSASLSRSASGARGRQEQALDAATNLAGYFAALGVEPDDADRSDIRVLLAAAFPDTSEQRLSALVRFDSRAPGPGHRVEG